MPMILASWNYKLLTGLWVTLSSKINTRSTIKGQTFLVILNVRSKATFITDIASCQTHTPTHYVSPVTTHHIPMQYTKLHLHFFKYLHDWLNKNNIAISMKASRSTKTKCSTSASKRQNCHMGGCTPQRGYHPVTYILKPLVELMLSCNWHVTLQLTIFEIFTVK